MRFFLDTCDINEIKLFAALGLIDGVTSNWALANKVGTTVGMFLRKLIDLQLDQPLEVSFQPRLPHYKYAEGTLTLYNLYRGRNENIQLVPKVPVFGEYIKAGFVIAEEAPINATMIVEPWQMDMATKLRAKYASVFVSRVLKQPPESYEDPLDSWSRVEDLYYMKQNVELVFASIKTVQQVNHIVTDFGGSDNVITIPPEVFREMLDSLSVQQIFSDWEKPEKGSFWKEFRRYLGEL